MKIQRDRNIDRQKYRQIKTQIDRNIDRQKYRNIDKIELCIDRNIYIYVDRHRLKEKFIYKNIYGQKFT